MQPFRKLLLSASLVLCVVGAAGGQPQSGGSLTQVPVVISGGHETDPQDRGRPVSLVAGALGVPPEVFREAFRHVRPAPAGMEPDPQQVRLNKSALLSALSRYGVSNAKLDTVSDYYRYVRSRNETWPAKSAVAYALVKDRTVVKYVVTSAGSGYSSPPTVTVPGVPGATSKTQIAYSSVFAKNGALTAIVVLPPSTKKGDRAPTAP